MPKPFVKIKLDRERHLRFTLKALLEVEEHFGVPYHSLNPQEWKLQDVLFLLWVGLKHEDESLTFDDVVRIADEAESLSYVFEKVAQAFQAAFVGNAEGNRARASS